MVSRRYEIYLRVFKSIAHEWAQRTSEISDLNTRRYLQETMYYPFYYINLLITMFLTIFRRFPTISEDFRKFKNVVRRLYEYFRTFSENFRSFPKIAEDCRRLPRKIRRFFDLISIYFGLISIGTWQTLQADWSKMISHMCGYHFYPHMCDTIFLDLLPLAKALQFI